MSCERGSLDEFESTRIIGERQFKKAVDLFNMASIQLDGNIDYRHTYIDFSQLEVKLPKQEGGFEVVKTCPAAMGFAFAAGTTDGPGAFDFKQGDDKVIENYRIHNSSSVALYSHSSYIPIVLHYK